LITAYILYLIFSKLRGLNGRKHYFALLSSLALLIVWLPNIEGATRLVFLGFEIDNRIESAKVILERLATVEQSAQATSLNLTKLKTDAEKVKSALSEVVTRKKQEIEITRLRNAAISGDRSAYNTLRDYPSEDQQLKVLATAAIWDLKGIYIAGSRPAALELKQTLEDGTIVEQGPEFKTSWLLIDLVASKKWRVRALAAELLSGRKEKGIPEVLLNAMEHDPNLWVAKAALKSFESITGYKDHDIFEFDTNRPRKWYEKNYEKVTEKLKDSSNNSPE
jgi:hypothetical protein